VTDTAVAIVFVTAPGSEVAERLVQSLVEERLAACGSVLPGITSIYRWEDRIERATEVQVMLKTATGSVAAVIERVRVLHPYDVPEILAVPVTHGLESYVSWVAANSNGG
jgi:periplasmic divalent cation tolerance protein